MIRRTNRLIVFILLVGLLLSLTSCSSVKTEEKSFQAFTVPVPEGWTQINLNDVVAKDYLLTWFIPEGTDASENIEAGMIVFVGQAYAKGTTPYGPYEFGQKFTDLYNIFFVTGYDQRKYGVKEELKDPNITIKGMESVKAKANTAQFRGTDYICETYEYTISAPYKNKYDEDLSNRDVYIIFYVDRDCKKASSYRSLFKKIAKGISVDEDLYKPY